MSLKKRSKTERIKDSQNQNKAWSETDDLKLIELYKNHSYADIGKILGRTPASCASRVYSLNHDKAKNVDPAQSNSQKIWTWEEDQLLLELTHKGRTSLSISRQMKRTEASINGRLQHLKKKGIVWNPNAEKPRNLVPIDEYKAVHNDQEPTKEVKSKRRRKLEEMLPIIQEYRKGGVTFQDLKEKYGIPHNTIAMWNQRTPMNIPTVVEAPVIVKEKEPVVKKEVKQEKVEVIKPKNNNDLQSIIDTFKGVKGTTILVIHQD